MGYSHIAIAVKDMEATHRFYTEAMGFKLVKAVLVPKDGGFARHVFYSTGSDVDQLIAFWDLSQVPGCQDIRTNISLDLGHDAYTNHIAFSAESIADLDAKRQHWNDLGYDVLQIDHGWVQSIYIADPDGITVEFAVMTETFTDADAAEALELLRVMDPELDETTPPMKMHRAGTEG
jgi:catechol 2,3-dioxygenase-like lactoylglutathione lyase family enzyme